jgi:hypothetical protein
VSGSRLDRSSTGQSGTDAALRDAVLHATGATQRRDIAKLITLL